jgi:uncharacterized membrane protein
MDVYGSLNFLLRGDIHMQDIKKIYFKKSYEDIEIAGKQFRISMKDEDRKRYADQLEKFHVVVKEIESVDAKEIDFKQSQVYEEKMKEMALETLDVVFGDGAGEDLYSLSGEQTEELIPLVFLVAEILNERREEKLQKYTKKPKK